MCTFVLLIIKPIYGKVRDDQFVVQFTQLLKHFLGFIFGVSEYLRSCFWETKRLVFSCVATILHSLSLFQRYSCVHKLWTCE